MNTGGTVNTGGIHGLPCIRAWVETVMVLPEWDNPPPDALLDYVPVGARPLFTQLYTEMLEYLERYPGGERRWFMLVRLWPAVVTAPIRRA